MKRGNLQKVFGSYFSSSLIFPFSRQVSCGFLIYSSAFLSNLKLLTKMSVPKIKVKIPLEAIMMVNANSSSSSFWMGESYHGCNISDKFSSCIIFEVMEAAMIKGVKIMMKIRLALLDFQVMIRPVIMYTKMAPLTIQSLQ